MFYADVTAGVRRQDRRSSSEVAKMCGVENLSVTFRQTKRRWFGHVKMADGEVLGEVGREGKKA